MEEITLSQFEARAKKLNKRGMQRGFVSMAKTPFEYTQSLPLGLTNEIIVEAIIDKDYVNDLMKIIKSFKLEIIGGVNHYFIGKVLDDFDKNKKGIPQNRWEGYEALRKDYNNMLENKTNFVEMENEDVKFYFKAFNEDITNVRELVYKLDSKLDKLAKKNDITIFFNFKAYCDALKGFMAYNFFDLDEKEEGKEVVVEKAYNAIVGVDFSNPISVYAASVLLTSLADEKEVFDNSSFHINAENF